MTSSLWSAHGNEYLVAEGDYEMGHDGALEVDRIDGDDVWVTIRNPDGSVAELSGNGTRIAGAWLMERTGNDVARVHVGPRTVEVRRVDTGYESAVGEVERHAPEQIAEWTVRRVIVGNPHAVVVGDPDELPEIGPALETHPAFPNRTNVQVARVVAPGEVVARVWERGVGETAASGTSAVAVAAATHEDGNDVVVHFPGGDLLVSLHDGEATLTGPAIRIA